MPTEVRAAGIRILSPKVDIANVRLAFENGCVANMTASRVTTEKIRKLRLFQPEEYISLDYSRQDIARISVRAAKSASIRFRWSTRSRPAGTQLFLQCVRNRQQPVVTGTDAARALEVCLEILDKIEEHGAVVQQTVSAFQATTTSSQSS